MSKARTLANLISDNAELADGQISVAEVVGAAPTASPTFTGNIGVAGNITNASGNLTLDVAGDIILDADGANIVFKNGGTEFGQILTNATPNDLVIRSSISDEDIVFQGNDGGSIIAALTLDMSAEGNATFQSATTARISLQKTSSDKANIFFDTSNGLQFDNSSYNYPIKFDGSSFVFNEQSNDSDFRVESNTDTHALFVDASSNTVGLGMSDPSSSYKLNVNGNIRLTGTAGTVRLEAGDTSLSADQLVGRVEMYANDTSTGGTGVAGYIEVKSDDQYGVNSYMALGTRVSDGSGNPTERLKITKFGGLIQYPTTGGDVILNENGVDADFRVESNDKTHMLFVDAGNNAVQIGSNMSQTQGALDVGFSVDNDTTNVVTIGRGLSGSNTAGATSMGFPYLTIGSSEYSNSGSHYRGIGFGYWVPNSGYAASRPPAEIAYYDESTSGGTKGSLVFGTRDTITGSGVPVERMRIHADGKVTINDTGTDSDFRVESDDDANALFVNASANAVFFGGTSTSGTGLSYISTSGSIDMRSAGENATSTRFRWHSPQFNSGGQTKHGVQLFNGDSDNLQLGFISDSGGSQGSLIDTSNTDIGCIIRSNYNGVRLSNGSTSWSSYSDSRLKTVTGEIPNALDKIDAMRGVLFSWKNDEDNTQRCGVIAQEVQAVLPEVVDDDTDYLQVRYTELVPLLIQGIKEQKATIETLEARITALENA
jgi:hypothetical protein